MNFNPENPKWSAYLLNELPVEKRREVEKELAENPEALAWLEEMRAAAALVEQCFAKEGELALSVEGRHKILSSGYRKPAGKKVWFPTLAAAAVVAICLGVYNSITVHGYRSDFPVTEEAASVDAYFLHMEAEAPPLVVSPSLDHFDPIESNPFRKVSDHPLSTFSIDVDTASYAVVRKFLNEGRLPPADAVRIEELINYFPYDYRPPEDGEAFAAHMEAAACPWAPEHALVRIALKGREIPQQERPALNLVYLLDVSGSMNSPNKLPLVKRAMEALVTQLDERDQVAIVVYAGAAGLVLPTTSGSDSRTILDALNRLSAGGGTAGGAGIELAYKMAREQFVEGGVNRVILCTDGDFNIGITQTGDLQRLIEKEAASGVFLTALGFGMGNYKDSMLETLSNKGNGNYAYIDDFSEARKVLVDEMLGTLITIAKDVKIQVEFNPAQVAGYRLIGYENRMLSKEDFNNDKVDAGEIGAGHTVTAFYELVPAGKAVPGEIPQVDDLKYQRAPEANASEEILTLKVRHKQPDGEHSVKREFPLMAARPTDRPSTDFQFAASVAAFGMWLRDPDFENQWPIKEILKAATDSLGGDEQGYRREYLDLIRNASVLTRE